MEPHKKYYQCSIAYVNLTRHLNSIHGEWPVTLDIRDWLKTQFNADLSLKEGNLYHYSKIKFKNEADKLEFLLTYG